ncbi:MAG: hypothetical protein PHC52_04690 [Syntrophales bacterium]|nr:hypothetical protein [Syntrophales bacterium]
MDERLKELNRYLSKILGINVQPKEWQDNARLSFHLRSLYSFVTLSILNTPCLLILPKEKKEAGPAEIAKHIEQIRRKWDGQVIYLHDIVSAYNRNRLIEHRINFVIPGKQMYLPVLALDLREHFNQARDNPEKFTKATQLAVLYMLINGVRHHYTPSNLAQRLGYTLMSMTRAFREIESLGLADIPKKGRELFLVFQYDKKSLWEKALEYMQSPVRKRAWAYPPTMKHWRGLTAGLSALAEYSMLAAPPNPVAAVSLSEWRLMKKSDLLELQVREPDAHNIEIWSYVPQILAGENAALVDRFSLYLTLKDDPDERVQAALEKMMEENEW